MPRVRIGENPEPGRVTSSHAVAEGTMTLTIAALEERHLEEAADLAGTRFRARRARVPALSDRYADPQVVLPQLRELAGRAPGVVALQRGRVIGFRLSAKVADLWGRRAALSPQWANAAAPGAGRPVYEGLYAALAPRWTANGCFVHAVGLLAADGPARDVWHWLGFGLATVDAVRDLTPPAAPGWTRRGSSPLTATTTSPGSIPATMHVGAIPGKDRGKPRTGSTRWPVPSVA